MLSPHECVVRLGCSWTPQARQHAEVQDVDDSVAVEAGRDGSRHSCVGGNSFLVRRMDPRLRGNDAFLVAPAEAGIHHRDDLTAKEAGIHPASSLHLSCSEQG